MRSILRELVSLTSIALILSTGVVYSQDLDVESDFNVKKSFSGTNEQVNLIVNLQSEVQQLRGAVEVLSYKLRQIEKRRVADYINLDKRLSSLSTHYSANSEIAPTDSYLTDQEAPLIPNLLSRDTEHATSNGEPQNKSRLADDYRVAFELLKQKKTSMAITKFENLATMEPRTPEAAMALYWLGRIYSLKQHVEQARQRFIQFVDSFPAHNKYDEVNFLLGKIYFQLQNEPKAIEFLKVALKAKDVRVRQQATDFIKTNLADVTQIFVTPTVSTRFTIGETESTKNNPVVVENNGVEVDAPEQDDVNTNQQDEQSNQKNRSIIDLLSAEPVQ